MSQLLKVVIADDDEPVCNLLCTLLSSFAGVEVAGTATDGNGLVDLVEKTSPDAVFVDIQMPGLDGLSAVHRLQQKHPGLFVVFVSAYTQYAVEAFNLDAADYLVKPVNPAKLGRALEKVRRFKELLAGFSPGPEAKKSAGPASQNPDRHNRLVLRYGHGVAVIDPSTIFFVEKSGKKCVIHTARGLYKTADSLISLERRLDPSIFFRCHKSFIINIRQVERIIPYTDRAYEVYFYNYSQKVTMRRDKFEKFCRLIGGER